MSPWNGWRPWRRGTPIYCVGTYRFFLSHSQCTTAPGQNMQCRLLLPVTHNVGVPQKGGGMAGPVTAWRLWATNYHHWGAPQCRWGTEPSCQGATEPRWPQPRDATGARKRKHHRWGVNCPTQPQVSPSGLLAPTTAHAGQAHTSASGHSQTEHQAVPGEPPCHGGMATASATRAEPQEGRGHTWEEPQGPGGESIGGQGTGEAGYRRLGE